MRGTVQNIGQWGYKAFRGSGIFKSRRLSKAAGSLYRYLVTARGRIPIVNGFKMYLPDASFFTYALGNYEPSVTNAFLSHIRPGDIVIDIGANVGFYTLLAARQVGNGGEVYAFEADPDNFKTLTDNVAINSFTNVKSVRKAVSNRTGKTKFYKKGIMGHSLYDHEVSPTTDIIAVDTVALDDFLCDCPTAVRNRISLIKMDIEGAEPLALDGMAEFLRNKKELTLISELVPSFYTSNKPSDYIDQLRSFDFTITVIEENGEVPLQDEMLLSDADKTYRINLLCSKPSSSLITGI
jgi:FkbM family methyltransferase